MDELLIVVNEGESSVVVLQRDGKNVGVRFSGDIVKGWIEPMLTIDYEFVKNIFERQFSKFNEHYKGVELADAELVDVLIYALKMTMEHNI